MKQRDQPRHGAPPVGIHLGVGARLGRREEEHLVFEILAPFAPRFIRSPAPYEREVFCEATGTF